MSGALFLQLESPVGTEVVVNAPKLTLVGRTRVDAAISVNDSLVEPDLEGRFRQEVDLEIGANVIEIVVSVASGEQKGLVLTVIYLPE